MEDQKKISEWWTGFEPGIAIIDGIAQAGKIRIFGPLKALLIILGLEGLN